MTLRKGHGNGAGQPRIEVLPADELPDPQAGTAVPLARRQDGRIADSAAARELGAMGGARKAARARLVTAMGLEKLAEGCDFIPYRDAADVFVRAHLAALAAQAGGEVGVGPASIVASAGLQLAASRYLAARGAASGDAKLLGQASGLANDSRQNLLAAYELAQREAAARRANGPVEDDMDRIRRMAGDVTYE